MKLVFPGGEHPQVLLDHGVSRVGSGPDANILLDHPGVMPSHCELHVGAHGVALQVPHGAAVRVNGRAVEGLIALRPGDLVSFEQVQARLASLEASVPVRHDAEPMQSPSNDDLPATAVRPVVPRYVLRGISSAGFGRTFPVLAATTLGRSPECGIHFNHPGLSRRHARLTPTDQGLLIEDLGSTNGCLLNDAHIDRAWATHGDELGVDSLRFRVVMPGKGEPIEVAARSAGAKTAAKRRHPPWGWLVGAALLLVAGWTGVVLLS